MIFVDTGAWVAYISPDDQYHDAALGWMKHNRQSFITTDYVGAAWKVFHDYEDKAWSFTDCTSKIVMQRFEIAYAFTFDQHFRQFGTVAVVP